MFANCKYVRSRGSALDMPHNLRTAEGFEKCSQNGGRARYLPLESNISN